MRVGPNLVMGLLALAIFCCCVTMAMPLSHMGVAPERERRAGWWHTTQDPAQQSPIKASILNEITGNWSGVRIEGRS